MGMGTRIIANAKPEFIFTLTNAVGWRRFRLESVLEWQKGGDIWNGTAASLDYYGRSAASAVLRTKSGYVFDGVTLAGHPNTQAVTFYDPEQSVYANRWTRYGPGGVGENYIESNNYLSLRRLGVVYDVPFKKLLQKMSLTIFAENIFLWQDYSGASPGQMLYDQVSFSGLDCFRLPSDRRYGASIHLQF